MGLKSDIAARLVADTDFAAAVGTDDGSAVKLYSMYVPQYATPPYMQMQRRIMARFHHYDGASAIYESTFDLNAYGTTPDEADAIIAAVAVLLDGKRGTWGSTSVRGSFLNDDQDLPEHLRGGEEFGWYRVLVTLTVWHA